jgi:hypothetical protein
MKQLTPAEEESYVRAQWDYVDVVTPGRLDGGIFIDGFCPKFLDFHETYLFTVHRKEEIADIQAEIAWLEWPSIKNSSIGNIRERILSREKADLADLRRGWKEQG